MVDLLSMLYKEQVYCVAFVNCMCVLRMGGGQEVPLKIPATELGKTVQVRTDTFLQLGYRSIGTYAFTCLPFGNIKLPA